MVRQLSVDPSPLLLSARSGLFVDAVAANPVSMIGVLAPSVRFSGNLLSYHIAYVTVGGRTPELVSLMLKLNF
ncbi:hypothetical protein KDW41_25070 [Burkholderia vietnamiensis]|nr:hypothetical protein [Burkholderia vietnamiensis]